MKFQNDGVTVIYDPLDVFYPNPHQDPIEFWRKHNETFGYYVDIWVATSPACRTVMIKAGIKRVAMIPHWPDPRVKRGTYNAEGPIVYDGLKGFVEACPFDFLHKRFDQWGVSLRHDQANAVTPSAVLCARFGSTNTPLNSLCKPQIKLANALAARLPALVGDQAGLSLLT